MCILRFLEERDTQEIAQILGRPKKTVETQLYRARAILQKQIKEVYSYEKIDESSVGMPLDNLELFTADGHLTDSAFALLIQEKLDPLQSLEVSEHLSFCDRCLERYTAILCGEPIPDAGGAEQALPVTAHLIEPPQPLLPGILQKLRQRAQVFI